MTETVSASLPIKIARQNYYATMAIDLKGSLTQAYDTDSGTPTPDWSVAANRPTLTPRIICAATYSVVGYTWYRDNTLIGTSGSGASDTKLYQIGSDGSLTILDNLVSAANLDPDTFTCKATISVNGVEYKLERAISATLLPLSSNGYVVTVSGSNGTALDSDTTSTTLTATVYYGGEESGSLTYQWYKGGTAISSATSKSLAVSRDDVDWEQLYRVVVKDTNGNTVGIGGIQVTDQADNYALQASISGEISSSTPATVKMQLRQRKSAADAWTDLGVAATYKAAVYDVADTDTKDLTSGTLGSDGSGSFTISYTAMTSAGIESGMVEITATW